MAFPQSFMDELTARSDIVDVVGSYVQLTRKGSNLFGLCPFHSEKTGSFSVSPDKQIYYCFGCKKGGGVVNFIMDIVASALCIAHDLANLFIFIGRKLIPSTHTRRSFLILLQYRRF